MARVRLPHTAMTGQLWASFGGVTSTCSWDNRVTFHQADAEMRLAENGVKTAWHATLATAPTDT